MNDLRLAPRPTPCLLLLLALLGAGCRHMGTPVEATDWHRATFLGLGGASSANGTLSGVLFFDANANGERDRDEPRLENFAVLLVQKGFLLQRTTTNPGGLYRFDHLAPGHYTVLLADSAGWIQTTPGTVRHVADLSVPRHLGGLDFGLAEVPCPQPTHFATSRAGVPDGFAPHNPEHSTPSEALIAWCRTGGCSEKAFRTAFDEFSTRRPFLHTFHPRYPDSLLIAEASLRLGVRATGSNDTLAFVEDGTRVWAASFRSLVAVASESPFSNHPRLTLDLAKLLPSEHVTNVLAALHDGDLDLVIGPDVDVDYLALDVGGCTPQGEDHAPPASAGKTAPEPHAPVTLEANYPNPFHPTTNIRFGLPEPAHVTLKIYNLHGREVATLADGPRRAGQHATTFTAGSLASGVYLYRLTAGPHTQTRRMLLVR